MATTATSKAKLPPSSPVRPNPGKASVGASGWMRQNLFNSWFNTLLTLLQMPEGLFPVFYECQVAKPLGSSGKDKRAKRAFGKTVVDGQGFSPVFVFARCHAFNFHKKIM